MDLKKTTNDLPQTSFCVFAQCGEESLFSRTLKERRHTVNAMQGNQRHKQPISELPFASVSKRGVVQSLSYENEFYSHAPCLHETHLPEVNKYFDCTALCFLL